MRFGHARDQDLLLLAHGALPPLRRALMKAHLRHCPPCRQRRQQLLGVSEALAGAIRDPSDPPWRPPASARPGPLAVLIVTLSLLVVLGIALATGIRHAHHARPVSPYSGGCRPDLPNDRCR